MLISRYRNRGRKPALEPIKEQKKASAKNDKRGDGEKDTK